MLPHDWLTWRLRAPGRRRPTWSPTAATPPAPGISRPRPGSWLPDVVSAALGHPALLPRVARPAEAVGETAWGAVVAAGTGDNMGAALGLGLQPGEVAVSIGTSGTAFAVTTVPAADPSGAVAGFADATGRFLPLVCTVNAGLVLSAVADLIGTDLAGLSAAALAAGPGAGGITLLPYLDGERTPNRPRASGVLRGLTTRNATRQNLARAAVEAVLASLADAAGLLAAHGVEQRGVLLIGGGARSEAVRQLAPGIFGAPVDVPEPEEYVALGAARQAAWALAGTPDPPAWPRRPAAEYTGPRRAPPPRPVRRTPGRHRHVGSNSDRGTMNAADPYRPAPQRPVLVRHLDGGVAGSRRVRPGGTAADARRPGGAQARRTRRLRGQLPRQRRVRLRRGTGRAGPRRSRTSGRR